MIIAKLTGGLGNQMFQYAMGRRCALVNHTQLKLDLSFFEQPNPGTTPRSFRLNAFAIAAERATEKEIHFLRRSIFMRARNKFLPWWKKNIIKDYHRFDSHYLRVGKHAYLIGDWQSEEYFRDIADTIRKEFSLAAAPTPSFKSWKEKITRVPAVSLHVRRGDYVNNPTFASFYARITPQQYRSAAAHIQERVPNPHFFVFSDDIAWCKENLSFLPSVSFVSDSSLADYEEMLLMAHCKHHIIANSSFSWWGAWLNPRPDKIVLAPRVWFKDPSMDTSKLIPKPWIRY